MKMIFHFYCCYAGDIKIEDRHKSAPCLIQVIIKTNISINVLRAMLNQIGYVPIECIFHHISKLYGSTKVDLS